MNSSQLSSAKREDLAYHRVFQATQAQTPAGTGCAQAPVDGRTDLTRGACEDPTVPPASSCSWSLLFPGSSQGWVYQSHCFPFFISLAFITGVTDLLAHIFAISFPWPFSQWPSWSTTLSLQLRLCAVMVYSWRRVITPKTSLPKQDFLSNNFIVSCSRIQDTSMSKHVQLERQKIAFCGALAWGGIWAITCPQLRVTSAQHPFVSVGFVPVSWQRSRQSWARPK